MKLAQDTGESLPPHPEEPIRDHELKVEADRLALSAKIAFEDGRIDESKELFQESLAANMGRTGTYRFRQALELFIDYRKHHRLDAEMSIEDLVVNRYERDSFEHTALARALLMHGLLEDDAPLIGVAEEMIDDVHVVVATIIHAAQAEKSVIAARGHLRRAEAIIETVPIDKTNEQKLKRTYRRITKALQVRGVDC